MVEYDPESQWYNASITISTGWIKQGGKVWYNTRTKSPDDIRSKLVRLGVNVEELENEDKLRISDWYSATLGQKSKEKYAQDSLKVADLSIMFSRDVMRQPLQPEWLRISDNVSTLARFNDEKAFVEFFLKRAWPTVKVGKAILIAPLLRDVHSDWFYKMLEAQADGIIDFKLEETGDGGTRDLMRIRSMQNVAFTKGWHLLKVGENFEVTLEK